MRRLLVLCWGPGLFGFVGRFGVQQAVILRADLVEQAQLGFQEVDMAFLVADQVLEQGLADIVADFFAMVARLDIEGAGIMLAASYFSLLAPALTSAHSLRQSPLLMCSGGFLLGGLLVLLADALLSRRMRRTPLSDVRRRTVLLIGSITLHNIPEGLAVGCAFGALASPGGAAWRSAWMLAIGIALQNFPEGAAVSLPLRRDGYSCRRSFFFGQLSGAVEPLAGILGALLAIRVRAALPLLLSLSGGAMVTVILAELLPECQKCPRQRLMVLATLAGFVLMMALDTMGIG